jgi:hypothetical protein
LDHRTKVTLAVVAALVVPSVLAWGVQSSFQGDPGDRARSTSARPAASPEPAGSPTPSPTGSGSAQSSLAAPTPAPTTATPSVPSPSAQVDGPAAPAQQAQRLPSSVAAERPTQVRLPGGRLVRVRPTRTLPDRSLGIPDDLGTAGWWRGGARLGDLYGSMLVAAHVDSTDRGLGPFVELLTVGRGARVTVTSAHLTQTYAVSARRIVARDRLPRATWVTSFDGAHRLTLVTCAPPYVKARGGYQNLAVVVATPVGPPTRR